MPRPRRRLTPAGRGLIGVLLAGLLVWALADGAIRQAFAQAPPDGAEPIFLPLVSRGRPIPAVPAPGDWLGYINYYRALADLPAATENPAWRDGCYQHGRYMVKNDVLAHSEDPSNPWYTPEGDLAAQSSNLAASSAVSFSDQQAIDAWMQAPFHAVCILDPGLGQVAFGAYREADGGIETGAALDVTRGLGDLPPSAEFPVRWPADGSFLPLLSFWGETPDPLTSCPGYEEPSGPPIILQLGPGDQVPRVTASGFYQNGRLLEHCVFDETSYRHPDPGTQDLGRAVLGGRDAVVLIPRYPLRPGLAYRVSITANGREYEWGFQTLDGR